MKCWTVIAGIMSDSCPHFTLACISMEQILKQHVSYRVPRMYKEQQQSHLLIAIPARQW
jgi:hypothetical protein